ncbi:MAG: tetratricopeptide repeat protein [Bacteroidota bacterium]
MPQTTVSLTDPEPAARQFTDRDEFKAVFDTALDSVTPDRHSVLMFYGVGGIGKSGLIRELRRRLSEERPADRPPAVHARVDFTDPENRLPTTALVRARSDLHRQGVPFLSFDIAFAHYWSLAYPHLPLSKSELRFLEEGEMLADLVDAARDIPGLGLISKIPRALDKTRKAFQTYWHKRGQEELRRIAALDDADKVLDWLYVFWAADVKAWLAEEPGRRAVLFLDTLEALGASDGGGIRGAAPDDWVREWAGHLHGVLVTIAGRQKLRWLDRDASWGAMIEQHLVGSLAQEDAEDFLRTAGVVEPDVRATIIAQSEGVPLYLDLAVDTYEAIRRAEDRTPRPDEFDANLDQLLRRFLHYLTDEQEAALYKLSVCSTFDLARYRDLMQTFGTGYPATADGLKRLRAFSFVEEPEPGRYALHDLVRKALEHADDPDERRRVQEHLLAQATAILNAIDVRAVSEEEERALREAFELQSSLLVPTELLQWYREAERPFRVAGRWALLQILGEVVLAFSVRSFGRDGLLAAESANNLGVVFQELGKYGEAMNMHTYAHRIAKLKLGSDNLITVTYEGGIGIVLQKRGDYERAANIFKRQLAVRRWKLGDMNEKTLRSLSNYASTFLSMGRLRKAVSHFRIVKKGYDIVMGLENVESLYVSTNLAYALVKLGNTKEAEVIFRKVLSIREQENGLSHKQTLRSIHNLAYCLEESSALKDAEELYRRALSGKMNELGPNHPETLDTTFGIGRVLMGQGRISEADKYCILARDGFEQTLGPDHPRTLMAINTLGVLRLAQGERCEAEELIRLSYARAERKLGASHSDTVLYKSNLRYLLKRVGPP